MAPSELKSGTSSRAWEALTPSLSEWILEAISTMNYEKCTPVQANTIPQFMGNRDVVVEAVTGSGKTLAFLIPIVERLLRLEEPVKKHHVAAIIISPTRELATQIHSVLCSLLTFHPPSAAALRALDASEEDQPLPEFPKSTLKVVPQLVTGGGSNGPADDLEFFMKASPNLLIATPGRLLDLLPRFSTSSFEVLVLDEADRLLDMGFKPDLQKILGRLPKQRRTGLFSASLSSAVNEIIRVGLRNPVRITVRVKSASGAVDKRTPQSLQLRYLITPVTHKFPALASLLSSLEPTPQRTIVYVSTCATVDYFSHLLPPLLSGFAVIPLHGKQMPKIRQKTYGRFVNSLEPSVLLTTDLAARGLDVANVDLVVQLEPPSDPTTFVHRAGRAGRAGRRGLAVTFLTPAEQDYVSYLSIRKTPVTPLTEPRVMVPEEGAIKTTDHIRDIVLKDRALHDLGQRAFVASVQSYSKHVANSIFRLSDLPWEQLGHAWGLLRLPRMPELKRSQVDRSLGLSVDIDHVPYKDKVRERKRQEQLKARKEGQNSEIKASQDATRPEVKGAWSNKRDQRQLREERREKRKAKRDKFKQEKMSSDEKAKREELENMIRQVRQANAAAVNDDEGDEFHSFDD